MNFNANQLRRLPKIILLMACWLVLGFGIAPHASGQTWLRYYYPPDSLNGTALRPDQMVVAPNGDLLFAGTCERANGILYFYLKRCAPNGDHIWFKTVKVPGTDITWHLSFLENCPGSGFIAGGSSYINGVGTGLIFKLSDAGNLLWLKTPAPDKRGRIDAAIPTPDGQLLITGTQKDQTLFSPFVYKINAVNGSTLWGAQLPEGTEMEEGSSIALAPDGTIVQTSRSPNKVFIRHLSDAGFLLKEIQPNLDAGFNTIVRRADADGFSFIIRLSINNTIVLRRYDYQGNILHEKSTPYIDIELTNSVMTPEGYAFVKTDPIVFSGLEVPVLYKMDLEGNIAPPIFPMGGYSVDDNHVSHNVKLAPNGGFYIVGSNGKYGGLPWFALRTDSLGHVDYSLLVGNVFRDEDLNCIQSGSETGLHPVQVRATNLDLDLHWQATTDSSGNYSLGVPPGDYEIESLSPGGLSGVWAPCPAQNASILSAGDTSLVPPIGLQPLVDCPILQLDIAAGIFRPCSTSVAIVTVSNLGTADTDSATVRLEVDPSLTYESSTVPVIAQNGNLFWFNAGQVAALGTTTFSVQFGVSCAAQMNEVLCLSGHVSPDSLCGSGTNWDGSDLKVRVICDGDSLLFRVSNVGFGDMLEVANLIIIEDYIILFSVPLQLPAGQDTIITIPNTAGLTYFGQIAQAEGFPGDPFASDGKDVCNTGVPAGMLLQYPLFAGGRSDARYCEEVRTSFDPNDKRGFPLGLGASHSIEPGISLRYMIRFQNTGNDTAFNIIVRDTLPPELDPATLRIGSGSHPFEWSISGQGVLAFKFKNILLPDSTTNEPLSHGFAQFSIAPFADLPLGTVIENSAAIFFDFNAPIITNTSWHTIEKGPFTSALKPEPKTSQYELKVSPNPCNDYTIIHLEDMITDHLQLNLYDSQGTLVRQHTITSPDIELNTRSLPSGLYGVEIIDPQGKRVRSEKLLKE